jgi:hypothetical protein
MTEQAKLENVSFVSPWRKAEIQGKNELQKSFVSKRFSVESRKTSGWSRT